MKKSLLPGLKHTSQLLIRPSLTVPNVSSHLPAFETMPPVFATAYMIGFMEATCIECLNSHLDDGEHTVGTYIDISHVAPTPIGHTVYAEVELIDVVKRSLTFGVSLLDNDGPIGKGKHQRSVIVQELFMDKIEKKRKGIKLI